MNLWATALSTAALLAQNTIAVGPLTENVINWQGIEITDNNGNLLQKLEGQTGWFLSGEGEDQALTYQFSIVLQQMDGGDLPEEIGLIWSMPLSTSTPANHLYESVLFVNASDSDTQKAMGAFRVNDDIGFTVGELPDWDVTGGFSAILRLYYEIIDQAGNLEFDRYDLPPDGTEYSDLHWLLEPSLSEITPQTWTLAFSRPDADTLGLKQGRIMVA